MFFILFYLLKPNQSHAIIVCTHILNIFSRNIYLKKHVYNVDEKIMIEPTFKTK